MARLFVLDKATAKVVTASSMEELRNLLPAGLTRLERNPQDDPKNYTSETINQSGTSPKIKPAGNGPV